MFWDRGQLQLRHWLRFLAISVKVSSQTQSLSRGLQPGSRERPTQANLRVESFISFCQVLVWPPRRFFQPIPGAAKSVRRGSLSGGIRRTWPSQRWRWWEMMSPRGASFSLRTRRLTSELLTRCCHHTRDILRRQRWSKAESVRTSSTRSGHVSQP